KDVFIPASHYRELYSRQQPPQDCSVWVACATDWRDEVTNYHFPFRLVDAPNSKPDSPNAYGITLRVGHFIALMWGHDVTGMALKFQGLPEYVAQIWPRQTLAAWPPARTLSEEEAASAMQVFADAPDSD